jgi:hypothetical protein
MKKLFAFVFIIVLCLPVSAQEKVYFAKPIDSRGFIIEDHITFNKNIDNWGVTEYGKDFDKYTSYIRDIVKKYSSYSDTVREYYIKGWKDEFSRLTDIKPGSRFYISSKDHVWESEVNSYYINLDDEIYGGVMFYPFADFRARMMMPDYELLVCSPENKITIIDNKSETDKNTVDKFKSKLLPMVKDLTYTEWEGDNETKHKVTSIKDDEIKIFKGNFTGKDTEYLVSYIKRLNFDTFASAVFIMSGNGKIILKPSDLKSDFTYTKSIGTVDTDGDGVLEIIIESGYYEGAGYELLKYSKDGFIPIANGFNWGV